MFWVVKSGSDNHVFRIKKHLPALGLALCLAACPLTSRAKNAVTIVENGKSPWRIVKVSPGAPAAFAADELRRYLEQMSGCKLPVTQRKQGAVILVGLSADLSAKDRRLLPEPTQGFDGYTIVVRPGEVIIAGSNQRGIVYGVYDFLEHLGCRWFYPAQDPKDPEVVPRRETISLETNSWAVRSQLEHRICNASGWFFDVKAPVGLLEIDWAMKNRFNLMGWQADSSLSKRSLESQYKKLGEIGALAELEKRGMTIHGPAHSFDQLLNSGKYFEEHPEWFGMREGKRVPQSFAGAQFCWSNREARKQFIDNAEAFIKVAPLIHIFCPIPFDGGVACDCPECKKVGASNLLMLLMSELIQRLNKICPGVLVETVGGYGAAKDPPTNLEIINPQQRVVWAHWARYHGIGYDDDHYDLKPNLEKWRHAVRNHIDLCQYYTDNFSEPWVMAPFTVAIEGDRKYILKNHVESFYLLMYPSGYWWNHGLNGYLAGRCFYDAAINPYDLIHDYGRNYFGPKAGELLGDYFEQWGRRCDLSYHIRGGATDEDRVILADQRKKFLEPAMMETQGDSVLSRRVGRVEKLHALAERLMEMQRQRGEIQKARKTGQLSQAEDLLQKARKYTDGVMAYFYSLADLNEGLMDRNEIPSFIKANVKNWIEEEEKELAKVKVKS
jgi:hypothetical protein